MRVENLWKQLSAAYREESPHDTHFRKVIALIQKHFREGHPGEECMWQTIVIISKGHGDFRAIGLINVLCKMVMRIMNLLLTSAIDLHENLHGLLTGQGTGTTSLEFKLLHQLMEIQEEVLYENFLGLHKAYDELD